MHTHTNTHTQFISSTIPRFYSFSTRRFPIKIKALTFALSPCFSSHISSAPAAPLPHATFALSISQSPHSSSPNTYQSLPPSHFCCCITFNYGKLKITSPEHRVTGRLALTALCCNSRQGKEGTGGGWGWEREIDFHMTSLINRQPIVKRSTATVSSLSFSPPH